MTALLQWNCCGFRANKHELDLLIAKFCPFVICLQETFMPRSITLRNFVSYDILANVDQDNRPHGGVSLLVKETIPQSQITLDTPLKAVAARVTLHRTITICSVYLPPSQPINLDKLNNLYQQLPSPAILLGDFNAHNILWGDKTDPRGEQIEKFLTLNNLCLWNDGSPTHISTGTGTFSSIDLSFCHPSLLLDFSWFTEKNPCGSDHFPIILENDNKIEERVPSWNLSKANWPLFTGLCDEGIGKLNLLGSEDPVANFTDMLCTVASQTIPKTSPNPKNSPKPWYNDDCKKARSEQMQAFKEFSQQPTGEYLTKYKPS